MRQILGRVKYGVGSLGFIALVMVQGFFLDTPKALATASYVASDVLGQTDFVSSASGTSSITFQYPRGTLVDTVDHRLFVLDGYNYRLLVFNLNTENELIDKTADHVLGQPDFDSNDLIDPPTSSSINSGYGGIAYDFARKRLFVSEYGSNRVLIFLLANGITDNMSASYVLGQPNFTTRDQNTSQAGMSEPAGLAFDPDTDYLYVSEYSNSRVTVFDVSPGSISNGMNASYVIGQSDFISSDSTCTDHGFEYQWPIALDVEHKRLFVGDGDGSHARVMVFNVANLSNGMSAENVLGVSSFDSCSGSISPTQSNLYYPYNGIAYDSHNQQLYVDHSDSYRRITVYDVNQITNGEDAIAVLGQPDFVSGSDLGATSSSFHGDYQGNIAFDDTRKRMFFPDTGNNRILIYSFINLPSSLSISSGTVSTAYSSSLSATQSQGTVSYSVSSGTLPPGLTLNSSTGLLSGTPTTPGTYNFSITAIDDNGSIGYFKDTKSYVLGITAQTSSGSTTPATKQTTSASDQEVIPDDVAATDTETTPDTTTPLTTTKTPTPAPKTTQPDTNSLSVVWWGVGGLSFLFLLILAGVMVGKKGA